MKPTDRTSVPSPLCNSSATRTDKGRLGIIEAIDCVARLLALGPIPVLALVHVVLVIGVAAGSCCVPPCNFDAPHPEAPANMPRNPSPPQPERSFLCSARAPADPGTPDAKLVA